MHYEHSLMFGYGPHVLLVSYKHRNPCTRDLLVVLLFSCNLIELGLPRDASWMDFFCIGK